MLAGEIRGQIDRIWNSFWSGGISNPLEVIEQITYLLFLKRLDELETAEELKANRERSRCRSASFPRAKTRKSVPIRTSAGSASRTSILATCTGGGWICSPVAH
jgi:type I restriction enzyme M protein